MPLDINRITHLIDQMHRSEDDAGDPIAAGLILAADGARGQEWVDPSTLGWFPLYIAHGNTGTTETFDPTGSFDTWHSATLDNNCTFTFTGPSTGEPVSMVLELLQDSTGGRLVTWPGSVVWPGGVAPTLSTTGGTTDILMFFTRSGGSTWFGFMAGSGSSSTVTVDATEFGIHAHIVSETHLSNGSVTTYTLDQAIEPGTVIAWNVTTLARLGVTEAQPDQATVSAAGSSGDSIVFDYATPIVI